MNTTYLFANMCCALYESAMVPSACINLWRAWFRSRFYSANMSVWCVTNYLKFQSMFLTAIILYAGITFGHQCVTFHGGICWTPIRVYLITCNNLRRHLCAIIVLFWRVNWTVFTCEGRTGENSHDFRAHRRKWFQWASENQIDSSIIHYWPIKITFTSIRNCFLIYNKNFDIINFSSDTNYSHRTFLSSVVAGNSSSECHIGLQFH